MNNLPASEYHTNLQFKHSFKHSALKKKIYLEAESEQMWVYKTWDCASVSACAWMAKTVWTLHSIMTVILLL